MVFTRFVEIGRVACINYGPDAGKLCVIVNVLDTNRALVDGPKSVTGVSRQLLSFKRMTLTDFVLPIQHGAREKTIAAALKAADVVNKFAATKLGHELQVKKARASTTDFERFKLMVARKTKSRAIRSKLVALKKAAAPAAAKAPATKAAASKKA